MSSHISKVVTEQEQTDPGKAKNITSYLNNIGIVVAVWVMLYPHPYKIALSVALIYPLMTLYVFYRYRKAVSLEDDDDNKTPAKHPSLITALTLPAFGLVLRALVDYDLLVFSDSLISWAIIFLVLSIAIILLVNASSYKFGLFTKDGLAVILFIVAYSYGSFIIADCLYDNSKADIYHASVLDKHVSSGKHTTYYLKLDTWGQRMVPEDVSVPRSLYNETQPGESINVYVKKGTLNVPWYYIDK